MERIVWCRHSMLNTGRLAQAGQPIRSRYLWRIAPMAAMTQTGFVAIVGLWTGPWLREAAGLGIVVLLAGTLAALLRRSEPPPERTDGDILATMAAAPAVSKNGTASQPFFSMYWAHWERAWGWE